MRPHQLALLLSTALFAHAAANAGQVTLFSGPDMSGQEMTVRGDVTFLQNFDDRAMSLVVHSGRWEVCFHPDFSGECRVYDAGQHRNLDRFNRQISSVREIDGGRERGQGRGRNRDRNRDQAGVMLFDGTDLRGRSVAVNGDINTLVSLGFNDRAQSMTVRGGTWEFCQHSDFRGQCRVYGPGEYRNLDRAFHRSISSARQVGGQLGGQGSEDRRGQYSQRDSNGNVYRDGQVDGYGQRDGYDRRDQNGRNGAAVELFEGQGFGGQRVTLNNELRTLEQINFNDRAGSLVIYSGEWEFCQHADFRGQCTVYGPGRYDRLGSLQNGISSVRRVR